MKTHPIHPLLLALALAFTAHAQTPVMEPGKPTDNAKPEPTPLPANEPHDNIEIDVSFVAFGLKEIEEMARRSPTTAPTQEGILKAWMAGKGKLLSSSKTTTIPGQQAKTEGVLERIYPTEYEPPRVYDRHAPTTKDDWMSQPTPGGFQTRILGLTVNATAVVSDDRKTISVPMNPELAEFIRWNNIEAGEVEGTRKSTMWMAQPDFFVRRTTTSFDIPADRTLVSGGMPDSTGKLVTYIFITAHLVPPAQNKPHVTP